VARTPVTFCLLVATLCVVILTGCNSGAKNADEIVIGHYASMTGSEATFG